MDPVKIIVTKPTGEEQGNLTDSAKVDIDIGNKCDFEIEIDSSEIRIRVQIFCSRYGIRRNHKRNQVGLQNRKAHTLRIYMERNAGL